MRRHLSAFAPMSKFTQHIFHHTCNLALHKALWRIQSSFLFLFEGWQKNLCITTRTLTTQSLCCAFRNLHSFWTLQIEGNCLSITDGNALNLWHHHLEQHHWSNWTTRLVRLRSRLVRCFHLASFRVRFSIRALPSVPQSIISFQTTLSSSFSDSISLQKHCKGASTSPWWFGKFVFIVPLDWFFAQAMCEITLELCMAVTHVLFVDDENRGDSIRQFSCFLFHVIELSFHKLLFVARLSFWSSTQTIESSRFSFAASSCPIFLFLPRVEKGESTWRERKQKERKHEDIFQSFCEVLKFLCYSLAFIVHSLRKGMLLLKTLSFNKDEKMFLNIFQRIRKCFDFQEFFRASKIACAIESSPDHCRVRWRCWACEVYIRSVVPDLVRGRSVASSRLSFYSVFFFLKKKINK